MPGTLGPMRPMIVPPITREPTLRRRSVTFFGSSPKGREK